MATAPRDTTLTAAGYPAVRPLLPFGSLARVGALDMGRSEVNEDIQSLYRSLHIYIYT